MTDQSQPLPLPPSRHHIRHIVRRTLSKSWDDSIFSESAQAAFWCALSLPPLLLGMLGSLAYVAPLFGPETLPAIQDQLISTAERFFSSSVVDEIIEPTVLDIVKGARGEVVSIGFVISLWAGSSAISSFVDSVVEAHDQTPLRHPVAATVLRAGPVRGDAAVGDCGSAVRRTRTPQNRRTAARKLGQRTGLRLLPLAVRHVCGRGEHPLSGVFTRTATVASACPGLGPGDGRLPGGDIGPAGLPDVDHQHRIHLWRIGDTDRVPAVRILPRLRDHAGRRTQRRHPGGVARVDHPCQSGPDVAQAQGRLTQR